MCLPDPPGRSSRSGLCELVHGIMRLYNQWSYAFGWSAEGAGTHLFVCRQAYKDVEAVREGCLLIDRVAAGKQEKYTAVPNRQGRHLWRPHDRDGWGSG